MLEGEEALVSEVVWGLRGADDDDILDADAVAAVLVVPRFCRAQVSSVKCQVSSYRS